MKFGIWAKFVIENNAGHGTQLGFPQMTTCVAVVARLQTELVGWHVTEYTLQKIAEGRSLETAGANAFFDYVTDGGDVDKLYIVGHVTGHDPLAIRDFVREGLGEPDLETESLDIVRHRKAQSGGEYDIFFRHIAGANPSIVFKKSSKVTRSSSRGGEGYQNCMDREADFAMKNPHRLRSHFVGV